MQLQVVVTYFTTPRVQTRFSGRQMKSFQLFTKSFNGLWLGLTVRGITSSKPTQYVADTSLQLAQLRMRHFREY